MSTPTWARGLAVGMALTACGPTRVDDGEGIVPRDLPLVLMSPNTGSTYEGVRIPGFSLSTEDCWYLGEAAARIPAAQFVVGLFDIPSEHLGLVGRGGSLALRHARQAQIARIDRRSFPASGCVEAEFSPFPLDRILASPGGGVGCQGGTYLDPDTDPRLVESWTSIWVVNGERDCASVLEQGEARWR